MPEIAFTCDPCKRLFGRYKRDDEPWTHECPSCGKLITDGIGPHGEGMKVSHLRLPSDQYDYVSPIDGKHISSKRAHRDHLKRHGVIELGNEKPELKPFSPKIPRETIRAEIRDNLERMKSHGTWREV
jgi:hypothetical protein